MNRFAAPVSFLLAAVLLSSCASKTQGYRLQDAEVLPPRDVSCPIEIFTSLPKDRNHQELGFVSFEDGKLPKTLEEAQELAHPYVCAAGGDGVVILKDRSGAFAKATIVRSKKVEAKAAGKRKPFGR